MVDCLQVFKDFFCIIRDENKTVFDWCKEGNVEKLKNLLENEKTDVNQQDQEVCCG